MLYAVLASLIAGLLSRRWASFLALLAGILLAYGGALLFIYLPTFDAPGIDKATASGMAVGMFVVHALIIASVGLVLFLLRQWFQTTQD